MHEDLTVDFHRLSVLLARTLGPPTSTDADLASTRYCHVWTTDDFHRSIASVRLDGRGVVVSACGPGRVIQGTLHTNAMVVVPSVRLLARIANAELTCPVVTDVTTMHDRTRKPWRGKVCCTTPEIAVEAVRALVRGDLSEAVMDPAEEDETP